MIEGLFLDRVDAESTGATVGGQNHLIVQSSSNETHSSLALAQSAKAGAEIALNPTIREAMPEPDRDGRGIFFDEVPGHLNSHLFPDCQERKIVVWLDSSRFQLSLREGGVSSQT
jgi:hypothetical protein